MKKLQIVVFFLLICTAVYPQKKFLSLDLKGSWKFSIGDDQTWAQPLFDDSQWESIYAPASWEDEGFHGYNGYAWYRKSFTIPQDAKGRPVYIELGRIDDADQVYCNGRLIGATGFFPPEYQTAYDQFRTYKIPGHFLNYNGRNVIAVRVYDAQLSGGMIEGPLRITILEGALIPEYSLEGYWSFTTGDQPEWAAPSFREAGWKQIVVPAKWESQGYAEYNGMAWYRKRFTLPEKLQGSSLVLLLGRIDDLDEAFINGVRVGSTGFINNNPSSSSIDQEWQQLRGYYIPAGVLKPGENVVAVRVYDGFQDGGIYDGPVGLITQKRYQDYWKANKKERKSFFEWLFE